MAETIRYSLLGKEDLSLGTSTFEARLADGRVVTLSQIDIGAILSDSTLSTRDITLDSLTVTTLNTSGSSSTLQVPEKADPGSPLSGELWINSGGLVLEYSDDAATPAAHVLVAEDTTQTLTNKTLTSPTINTPTIATPTFSGTFAGTYAIGGTPSLAAALDASDEDITAIDELAFTDAVANPSAAGRIRRTGNELQWRNSLGSMRLFYGESGTIMLFQQTTAPTGWTKATTHNDKLLRVVSGAAGSGGTTAFSTFAAVTTTGSHTITSGESAAHTHTVDVRETAGAFGTSDIATGNAVGGSTRSSSSSGSGGGHTHTIGLNIAYVDLILAAKD